MNDLHSIARAVYERTAGVRHTLSLAFAALVTGSRSIPLGDNGSLLRELALRARDR